jgi:hypothetical protein
MDINDTKKIKESIYSNGEPSANPPKVELKPNDFILDKNGYIIGVKSTVSKSKKESMMGYF